MENEINENFRKTLKWKKDGGVPLEVFVSDGIWLGGMFESRTHDPFVAIGPSDWDGEEDMTFFSSREEVESLIAQLRETCDEAFGKSE